MTSVAAGRPMPDVVRASRRRCADLIGSPERARPTLDGAGTGLAELRRAHPLAAVLPLIRELLVAPAIDTGLILAVTDARGRLVWVEGDRGAMRRAEAMGFVPGADWSESCVGTSAPGTAIVSGRAVQVVGDEHFAPSVHAWSCSAVPVRSPADGTLLGAIDVTGGANAVTPHTIPLLRAAAAAIVAPLAHPAPPPVRANGAPAGRARLRVLGRDAAILEARGRSLELSPRHSELLVLLADHPAGLSGPQLGAMLAPQGMRPVTLRAEIARLRAALAGLAPELAIDAHPYRLAFDLDLDAADVLQAIDRGHHRQALRAYAGAVLPSSTAPGIEELRGRTTATLREAVLHHGGVDALLAFLELPGHGDDVAASLQALRVLPARSPKRAAIVARLDALGR